VPSTVVDSPIGPLVLIASDAGLRAVVFGGRRIPAEGRSPVLSEAVRQLEAYFDGELLTFDLPLELHGTEFQRRCWLALGSIPYGQTVSYGQQARRLGLGSEAARAVAPRTAATRFRSSCRAIA
jgi:methylated-DNA-[protein]-cysteine S-methyltransferase